MHFCKTHCNFAKHLFSDRPLAEKHRDHALTGDWKDHRDCHVKPDLVLIYRKPDDAVLQLVRLGSHNELGLCARQRKDMLWQADAVVGVDPTVVSPAATSIMAGQAGCSCQDRIAHTG